MHGTHVELSIHICQYRQKMQVATTIDGNTA